MARIHRRTTQKNLNDQENHNVVVTHLEPDIMEFEVKWALGRVIINKASEGDGIPAELSQILKDNVMLLKCSTQYVSKFRKTQQWPQD